MSDTCKWIENDVGHWETQCNDCFVFNDDGPHDNHFIFCPFCGKDLEEVAWEEENA